MSSRLFFGAFSPLSTKIAEVSHFPGPVTPHGVTKDETHTSKQRSTRKTSNKRILDLIPADDES